MGACNAVGNLFRLAIVAATVIAISLQWSCQYDCNYALYTEKTTTGFGIWFPMLDNQCIEEVYDPSEADPFITAARSCLTFSMIAAVIGGVMVAFEWCICEVCCAGCLELLCFMGAWVLGACVNLLYLSELCTGVGFQTFDLELTIAAIEDGNKCNFGPASTLNAVASILYLVVCILLCCTPEPDPIWKQ